MKKKTKKKNNNRVNNARSTHLFVFLQVAAPGKRLVAVLTRVRVGFVGVGVGRRGRGCGCSHRGRGRGVRGRATVLVAVAVVTPVVMIAVVVVVMMVDCGTGPAVARGAAVRRRVFLRHGRAPRRGGLLGAHLARAAEGFCKIHETTTKLMTSFHANISVSPYGYKLKYLLLLSFFISTRRFDLHRCPGGYRVP